MLGQFNKYRYKIWDFNVDFLNKTNFHHELNIAFEKFKYKPTHSIGNAFSIPGKVLNNSDNFLLLKKKLYNSVLENIEEFGVSKTKYHLKLIKFWINFMEKNSSGKIHSHYNDFVLIFYYKVPSESAKFVMINMSNDQTENKSEIEIDNCNKSYLTPNENTCLLHEGNLLHGVSEHFSDETRIAFIFDFKLVERRGGRAV